MVHQREEMHIGRVNRGSLLLILPSRLCLRISRGMGILSQQGLVGGAPWFLERLALFSLLNTRGICVVRFIKRRASCGSGFDGGSNGHHLLNQRVFQVRLRQLSQKRKLMDLGLLRIMMC